MKHPFPAGTIVQRVCPGILGDGSVGRIRRLSDHRTHLCVDTAYYVEILEGRNRMEGWTQDAWAREWCVPLALPTPQWEV